MKLSRSIMTAFVVCSACNTGYAVVLKPTSAAGDDAALLASLDALAKAEGFSLTLVAPYPNGERLGATYRKGLAGRSHHPLWMMISYDAGKAAKRMPVQVTIAESSQADEAIRAEINVLATRFRDVMEHSLGKGSVEVTTGPAGQEW